MAGLVPAIYAVTLQECPDWAAPNTTSEIVVLDRMRTKLARAPCRTAWMAGTSPAMTSRNQRKPYQPRGIRCPIHSTCSASSTRRRPSTRGSARNFARGRKESHWMWFVFPQIAGLGQSPTSIFYAISSLDEAKAYLAHPVLGARLRECARLALAAEGQNRAADFRRDRRDEVPLVDDAVHEGGAGGATVRAVPGEVFRRRARPGDARQDCSARRDTLCAGRSRRMPARRDRTRRASWAYREGRRTSALWPIVRDALFSVSHGRTHATLVSQRPAPASAGDAAQGRIERKDGVSVFFAPSDLRAGGAWTAQLFRGTGEGRTLFRPKRVAGRSAESSMSSRTIEFMPILCTRLTSD